MNEPVQDNLRNLPSVNSVLEHPGVRPLIAEQGREVVLGWVRDGRLEGGIIRPHAEVVEGTVAIP